MSLPTPFVATAAGVFASAFRANFLPLWLHAFHHGQEMPRLEAIFHGAVHELNTATALVAELDEETALHMQRLAVGHVSSALLSAEDVCDATSLSAELCKFPLEENELGVSDDEFGRELAKALSWARAAWVSERCSFTISARARRGCRFWPSCAACRPQGGRRRRRCRSASLAGARMNSWRACPSRPRTYRRASRAAASPTPSSTSQSPEHTLTTSAPASR